MPAPANDWSGWGDIILIRPDPQIIWNTEKQSPLWRSAHARYHRSQTGGGHWEMYRKIPDSWQISYGKLRFQLKPMGFKHTGIFPEQAVNWDWMSEKIRTAGRPVKILNLFAYHRIGQRVLCGWRGESAS